MCNMFSSFFGRDVELWLQERAVITILGEVPSIKAQKLFYEARVKT